MDLPRPVVRVAAAAAPHGVPRVPRHRRLAGGLPHCWQACSGKTSEACTARNSFLSSAGQSVRLLTSRSGARASQGAASAISIQRSRTHVACRCDAASSRLTAAVSGEGRASSSALPYLPYHRRSDSEAVNLKAGSSGATTNPHRAGAPIADGLRAGCPSAAAVSVLSVAAPRCCQSFLSSAGQSVRLLTSRSGA